jgi:tetratricopeptide repeat protein 8
MPIDQLFLARSKFRRNRLDACIEICDQLLAENPGDQAAWFLKCKAVIKQNYLDDIELDEESFAEILMDENAIANVPRPGTSLSAPQSSSSNKSGGSYDQGVRPVTNSGRPTTGFTRPGSSRPMSGSTSIRDALQSSRSRTGTAAGSRPMTTLGREIRLGTASLSGSASGGLVNLERLNIKKYSQKPGLSMILAEYMLYVEHNTRKALEMCAEATEYHQFQNWYWKARLAKCYFKLGMLREAEKQFRSSIKIQPMINSYLELCNVYMRLDLPNTAMDILEEAIDQFPLEPRLLLGIARIQEQLNETDKAFFLYKKIVALDATHVEAIACVAAHHFYSDHPELSMRYYRRLLQMGVNNAEIWNNIGLCCFYSSQYDMALGCMERALSLAADEEMADVWYNIGHIGISLGDHGLAYQAFKVSVSLNPSHAEAMNNLAVLEMRRFKNVKETTRKAQALEHAQSFLNISTESGPHLFEPSYNRALMAYYRTGDYQESYQYANKSLELYPNHVESKDLLSKLNDLMTHDL